MDWIILVVLTALGAAVGYRKGALRMLLRLIAFAASYVAAWQLTPSLANHWINNHTVQGVIVYPVAGITLFVGTGITLNVVFAVLLKMLPTRFQQAGKPVGAFGGATAGLLVALLSVWSIGIIQTAWLKRAQPNLPISTTTSTPQQWAGKIIGAASTLGLGDDTPSAKLTQQLLSNPLSISEGLNYLSRQPDIRTLFSDADHYRAMVNGTPEDIVRLPVFQQLASDTKAMSFLAQMGLTGKTSTEQQQVLATHLATYAKNIEQVKNSPEYRNIITDPEITEKLKARDYTALLTNEKVRLLTQMLSQGASALKNTPLPTPNTSATSTNNKVSKASNITQKKVYRWKDKSGGIHFSETLPTPDQTQGDVIEIQY